MDQKSKFLVPKFPPPEELEKYILYECDTFHKYNNLLFIQNLVSDFQPLEKVMFVYKLLAMIGNHLIFSNSQFYAESAHYLFALIGVENEIVSGTLNSLSSDDEKHYWNIVEIEGQVFHFDVCFANQNSEHNLQAIGILDSFRIGGIGYDFFCVSTRYISQTRTIDEIGLLFECNHCISHDLIMRLSNMEVCLGLEKGVSYFSPPPPVRIHHKASPTHISITYEMEAKVSSCINNYESDDYKSKSSACHENMDYGESLDAILNDKCSTTEEEVLRPMSNSSSPFNTLPGIGMATINPMPRPSSGLFRHLVRKLFKKAEKENKSATPNVYSSVFAPGETKKNSYFLVQVYLHKIEDLSEIEVDANRAQEGSISRGKVPLLCALKNGDRVDMQLDIEGGGKLLSSETKSVIWQGVLIKSSFSFFVPKDTEENDLCCKTTLLVNNVAVGELMFIINIVDNPRDVYPEVFSRKFNKVFISYAHEDEAIARPWADAYKSLGIDYFFDRDYLKPGDIFPKIIEDFINSADLFVLFWSENAAKSEYVEMERQFALKRAYPKVQPLERAPLSIYPMSINPRIDLPNDMKETYNFKVS